MHLVIQLFDYRPMKLSEASDSDQSSRSCMWQWHVPHHRLVLILILHFSQCHSCVLKKRTCRIWKSSQNWWPPHRFVTTIVFLSMCMPVVCCFQRHFGLHGQAESQNCVPVFPEIGPILPSKVNCSKGARRRGWSIWSCISSTSE